MTEDEIRAMTEDEMLEGYLDGLKADSPAPSDNRSASYRHGFQNGRDDLAHKAGAPAAVRRWQAAQAIETDKAR